MEVVGKGLPLYFMGKAHKVSEQHLFMVKMKVVANGLRSHFLAYPVSMRVQLTKEHDLFLINP